LKIYDVKEVLRVFDNVIKYITLPVNLNPEKYSIELIFKVLVVKEFFELSLRAMENLTVAYFGIKISKWIIHFWENSISESVCQSSEGTFTNTSPLINFFIKYFIPFLSTITSCSFFSLFYHRIITKINYFI